jgi:hypothetical protein
MADGGATAVIAVSLLATAASTGISMYSANQAASSQAAIADYNKQISEQNAAWQMMASQRAASTSAFNSQLSMFNAESQSLQAKFDASTAQFSNEQMRMQSQFTDMQAELQKNTAAMLRQQAAGEEQQAQEQAQRIRDEKARILGLQKSQFAKGGVLSSAGSSLWVLSETADLYERQALDTRLLANLNASKARYEAGVENFNAGITSLEASATRDQANLNDQAINFNLSQDLFTTNLDYSASKLAFDDSQFEKAAAGAGYRIAQRQAEIEHMSGMAQSNATAMSSWGALASGIGSAAQTGMTYYGSRPASSTKYDGYTSYAGPSVGYRTATAA